jgi:hypothetical protein
MTTLGAADEISLRVGFTQVLRVRVDGRAILLGSFSQPRQVGRRLVVALVLRIAGIVAIEHNFLVDPLEMVLNSLGNLELGFLEVLGVGDQGRKAVADRALRAVPLALGRILGIQRRIQAVEVECIVACVAAEQLAALSTVVAVVTVLRGLTRDHVSRWNGRMEQQRVENTSSKSNTYIEFGMRRGSWSAAQSLNRTE